MESSGSTAPPVVIMAGAGLDGRAAVAEFRALLREVPLHVPGSGPVIVDLTGTECLDWATFGEITGASVRVRAAGRAFGVVCPAGPVRGMFAAAGADTAMDIADREEALACRRPQPAGRSEPARAGETRAVMAEAVVRLLTGKGTGPGFVSLSAVLSYDAGDPYAVRAAFRAGLDKPVTWTFGRDLLAAGLKGPAGFADVKIWPGDGDVLNVELASSYGRARFEFPSGTVREFVGDIYLLVPEDSEHGTAGAEIDGLFAPGGPLHGAGGFI